MSQWTLQAWGAIGATALFLGITCWWLTQDRSIPIFDAGRHLSFAFYTFEELSAGHFVHALTLSNAYPPLADLVGDVGILFGGINVAPPILAENFVFVPLLALGCYHVGRIAFDRTAGLLAVVFALGSPLITAQFHVFMTDAPETAMVAASLWAILATEGFTRAGVSVLAGVVVGLGLLTKEPIVFFVAGPIAVTAIRGRLKAWRGLLAFTLVALAIALPWYAHELALVKSLATTTTSEASNPLNGSDVSSARWSIENFQWYFWHILDVQLYAPLFAFSAIGWLWAAAGFVRRRPISRVAPELAIGAFVAWAAITDTLPHDTRYSMPLLVYLAAFGSGWITRLPRTGRVATATLLILVGAANVVGNSFGAGGQVNLSLPGANTSFLKPHGVVTVYSDGGFLVSAPERDGNLLATFRALRRDGISSIVLESSTVNSPAFSLFGLTALAEIAGLGTMLAGSVGSTPAYAVLDHEVVEKTISAKSSTGQDASLYNGPIRAREAPPCVRLADGTGVWIALGDPNAPGERNYCPSRHPQLYG